MTRLRPGIRPFALARLLLAVVPAVVLLALAAGTASGTLPYAISKFADQPSVPAGSPIGFDIKLINNGPPDVLFIQDDLPGGPGINWMVDHFTQGGNCQIGYPPTQHLGCSFPSGTSANVHVSSQTTSQSCGTYNNTARGAAGIGHQDVTDQASTTVACGGGTPTPTPSPTPSPTPAPFSITVLKLDSANNSPRPGVHMSLYAGGNCTGNPFASGNTDDKGLIDFPLAATGTYSVKEAVPPGFQADPDGQCKSATVRTSTQHAGAQTVSCPIANNPFPQAGCDQFDSGAQVNVRLNDGSPPFTVTLNGPTLIQRSAVHPSSGKDTIDTEIVAFNLSGTSQFGPITVHQSGTHPSLGKVTEDQNTTPGTMDFPATSFFDVFVDIQTDIGVLHNNDPVHMQCEVNAIPPLLCLYQPPLLGEIPLYTAPGDLFAFLVHAAHIPLPQGQMLVVFNNKPIGTPSPSPSPTPAGPNVTSTVNGTPRIDITYTPGTEASVCDKIVFVQAVRNTVEKQGDGSKKKTGVKPSDINVAGGATKDGWMTNSGWYVDGETTEADPYYNGWDDPEDGVHDGKQSDSNHEGKKPESGAATNGTMNDTPSRISDARFKKDSQKLFGDDTSIDKITYEFIVLIFCAKGTDAGHCFGYYTWTWSQVKGQKPTITQGSPHSGSNKDAVDALNKWKDKHPGNDVPAVDCP